MKSRMLRLIPILVLAIAAVTAAHAAAEKATVVRAGNLVLRMNGGVTPKKLPKGKLAPITLNASGSLATADGSHPPATKTVTIDFDKHGTINARGLAVCRPGKLQARSTKAAIKACRPAIVGRGRTSVEVKFPEQDPFSSSGPLTLFNGGVHGGVTTVYIHAYVDVPAPTAIVTVVRIKKIHKGPYGTRAVAQIPRIANGAGSLTSFRPTTGRGSPVRSSVIAQPPDVTRLTPARAGRRDRPAAVAAARC